MKTHKSLARLEALAGEYQESANNGTLTEDGWLDDFMTNYATSKHFINCEIKIILLYLLYQKYTKIYQKLQNSVVLFFSSDHESSNLCCVGVKFIYLFNDSQTQKSINFFF